MAQHGHLLALADEEGFVTILDTSAPLPQSLFVDEAWGAHPPPRAQWLAHTNAIFDLCWVLVRACLSPRDSSYAHMYTPIHTHIYTYAVHAG